MFHKVMDNLEICKTLLETILDVEIERVEHVACSISKSNRSIVRIKGSKIGCIPEGQCK